jgi:hypothetical protein
MSSAVSLPAFVEFRRIPDDRGDKSLKIQVDRDSEVDFRIDDEFITVNARVHFREMRDSDAQCARHERQVAQRLAARCFNCTEVGFDGLQDVRRRRFGTQHVLGRDLANAVERNTLDTGIARIIALDMIQDVPSRDSAVTARALNIGNIELVFLYKAPDSGRQSLPRRFFF